MAKTKRSKSQRQLTAGRKFLYRIAVGMAVLYLEVLWLTCRFRFVGLDRLVGLVKEHTAVIPVCWHQHLLVCARFMVDRRVKPLKPGFLISPSVDGEAPTMLAHSYGAYVVRGSGTYTPVQAVRGAYAVIKREGISTAMTPDGPRGPRFQFKPGAINIAQLSGKPVIPMAFAARPAKVMKTWDKFVVPYPFGKICIAFGEPYFPPREMSAEQLEEAQREMERRMHETFRAAKAQLDGGK